MIVEVVGAVIRDPAGRLLTVRKSGTQRFMLPGGKREFGEDDLSALRRELAEEIGVTVVAATLLGRFEAEAANEPGATVRSAAYVVEIAGEIAIQAEIEELLWIDPAAPPDVPIAPLLLEHILPALLSTSSHGQPEAGPGTQAEPNATLKPLGSPGSPCVRPWDDDVGLGLPRGAGGDEARLDAAR
jgi:8-oxo-dGTP diphosphatase